jgi:DNA-binding transcriptional ArsR family regulator/predicted nucleotidyltransferase
MRTIVLMIENSSPLDLALGRSSVRQRILSLLIEDEGRRLHLRELQRRAATSPGTASRELAKLVAAGLIEREAEGNQVYFHASASPVAIMLRSLLLAMPGPAADPIPVQAHRLPRARRVAARPEAGAAHGSASSAPLATDTAPATEPSQTNPRLIESVKPAAAPAHRVADPDALGLKVAAKLAGSLRSLYGEALHGVFLYGARAAGNASDDADVETIVVLHRVDRYGEELERTSHVCAALSHDFNVVVSRVFVARSAWDGDPDGPELPIRSEAIAV